MATANITPITRQAWSIIELAEALGVSHFSVRRAIERGDIRAFYCGARRIVPKDEAERVLREGFGGPRRKKN